MLNAFLLAGLAVAIFYAQHFIHENRRLKKEINEFKSNT